MRVIGADNLTHLQTWIDEAHTKHPDVGSHIGGRGVLFGWVMVHHKFSKQKLTGNSSTKSELISTRYHMPYNIWFAYFFELQVYQIKYNVLHQDNESNIRMSKKW